MELNIHEYANYVRSRRMHVPDDLYDLLKSHIERGC